MTGRIEFSFHLLVSVHSVKADLDEYEQLYHEFEQVLTVRRRSFERGLGELLQQTPAEEHFAAWQGASCDIRQYQSVYPEIYREGLFLALYSFLEHKLNSLCCWVAREIGCDEKLKKERGHGIDRALRYARKAIDFELSNAHEAIDFLKGANSLRNVVVHNGGILEERHVKALVFIEHCEHLEGSIGKKVSIQTGFMPAFAGAIRKLFDEFNDEMQRAR